jgi:hypothetical protein
MCACVCVCRVRLYERQVRSCTWRVRSEDVHQLRDRTVTGLTNLSKRSCIDAEDAVAFDNSNFSSSYVMFHQQGRVLIGQYQGKTVTVYRAHVTSITLTRKDFVELQTVC